MIDHASFLDLLQTTRPGERNKETIALLESWNRRYRVFEDEEDSIMQHLGARPVHKGEILWLQGSQAEKYMILHSGNLRLFRQKKFEDLERATMALGRSSIDKTLTVKKSQCAYTQAARCTPYDWDMLGSLIREVKPGQGFSEEPFLRHFSKSEPGMRHSTSAAVLAPGIVLEIPAAVYTSSNTMRAHLRRYEQLDREQFLSRVLKHPFHKATTRRLRLGDKLCRCGDGLREVYIVRSGELAVSATIRIEDYDSFQEKKFQLVAIGVGAMLGDVELLQKCKRHLSSAVATRATVLHVLPVKDVQDSESIMQQLHGFASSRRDFYARRALAELERARHSSQQQPLCRRLESALVSKIEKAFTELWRHSPAEAMAKAASASAPAITMSPSGVGESRCQLLKSIRATTARRKLNGADCLRHDEDEYKHVQTLRRELRKDSCFTTRPSLYEKSKRARDYAGLIHRASPKTPACVIGGSVEVSARALTELHRMQSRRRSFSSSGVQHGDYLLHLASDALAPYNEESRRGGSVRHTSRN